VPSLASLASRAAQLALIGPAIARLKRRATRMAIGGVLVAIFGAFALAYLVIGAHIALERQIGPLWAPLAIGVAFIALAAIAYLAFLRPRASESESADARAAAVRDKIAGPARRLEGQVASNPLQSLAIALAVGFAAASLLRLLRGRERAAEPPPSSPWPRQAAGEPPRGERPPWMREVVLRETERRRTNGKGA
jgi:hypothetical protein